jgi:hypothetical protein
VTISPERKNVKRLFWYHVKTHYQGWLHGKIHHSISTWFKLKAYFKIFLLGRIMIISFKAFTNLSYGKNELY